MGQLSGSISIGDRYTLARQAGFSPADAVVMAAISMAECANCDMSAINSSGDVSLWQINSVHWNATGGPQILQDPLASARAAYMVWKGAGGGEAGFKQWCVYPGGCGGLPGVANFGELLTSATVAAQSVDPSAPSAVNVGGSGGSLQPTPGSTANATERGKALWQQQYGHGILGDLGAPIGGFFEGAANLFKTLGSRGFWWAVFLFAAGVAAIIAGILLYFHKEVAEGAGQVARVAAVAA
jgi:hypothetical protein